MSDFRTYVYNQDGDEVVMVRSESLQQALRTIDARMTHWLNQYGASLGYQIFDDNGKRYDAMKGRTDTTPLLDEDFTDIHPGDLVRANGKYYRVTIDEEGEASLS